MVCVSYCQVVVLAMAAGRVLQKLHVRRGFENQHLHSPPQLDAKGQ